MEFTSSNLPVENEYPKLVRDSIPDIIRQKHQVEPPTVIAASDEEFLGYLLRKMKEEAAELEHSVVKNNMVEELADIMEIINAITKLHNLSMDDVTRVQKEKREKNGGFEKRTILLNKI